MVVALNLSLLPQKHSCYCQLQAQRGNATLIIFCCDQGSQNRPRRPSKFPMTFFSHFITLKTNISSLFLPDFTVFYTGFSPSPYRATGHCQNATMANPPYSWL